MGSFFLIALSLFGVGAILAASTTVFQIVKWVGVLAPLILIASVGTAIAYQNAPASTVRTFDFAYVGFALIWGAVFFGEWPDLTALAGVALIVVAGMLAVRRPA